jgi:hypothetical protein
MCMKNSLKVVCGISFFIATFFTSCDKTVETTPLSIDLSKTATIEGYVYADLNLNDYGKEAVPAGTKIILSLPYSDLYSSGATGNWVDTVDVDANGKFTVAVPADADGVTVTIKAVDFIYSQVQPLTASNATIQKIFSVSSATSVSVKVSETKVQIIEYNTITGFSDFDNYVAISGKVQAELNLSNSELEAVPTGTTLIFYGNGWSQEVTVSSDGTNMVYTVDVPASISIYCAYDFTASKNVWNSSEGSYQNVDYRYKSTSLYVGYFSVDTEDEDLYLGGGTEVTN